MGRPHSFPDLTEFTQGINVLDIPVSNIDDFFQDIHDFHPLPSRGPFGTK
jgi:hypothetical protein